MTFRAQQHGEDLLLEISPPPISRVDEVTGADVDDWTPYLVEFRRGDNWSFAHRICTRTKRCRIYIRDFCAGVTQTFHGRIISEQDGFYAGEPTSIDVTTTHPGNHTDTGLRDETTESGGWPGSHSGTTTSGTSLVLDTGYTTGIYTSEEINLGVEKEWRLGFQVEVSFEDAGRTAASLSIASADADFSAADTEAEQTARDIDPTGRSLYAMENDALGNIYTPSGSWTIEARTYNTTGVPGDWETGVSGRWYGRYLQFRLTLNRNDATDHTISIDTMKVSSSRMLYSETSGASELNELTDVTVSTYNAGQGLVGNGAGEYVAGTVGLAYGGTNASLAAVDPLDLVQMNAGGTALESASIAVSELATSGHAHAIGDLTDVTITAAATRDVLRYSGAAWVDAALEAADIQSGTFDNARIAQGNVTQHVAAIDHDALLNFAAGEHFTEASIDHTAITNIGTTSHAALDTHVGDSTIHFTEASIDHTAITNIGSYSHASIDTHIDDATIHFTEASIDHTAITNIGSYAHSSIDTHIDDATLHFTEASIDHTAIANIGTNAHSVIDSHIADTTLHFTEASIDHTAITNIGTNSHATIDTHIADGTLHFLVGAIDHTAILNIGTNAHSVIDTHLGASVNVHGVGAGISVAGTVGDFTEDHLASFNDVGVLVDSGSAASDFAAASHAHAAGDITSGQIALARGGTAADLSAGSVDLQFVRFNSDSTALEASGSTTATFAAASHAHGAGDITSGTLAIARGGTNAASYTALQLLRMNAGGTAFESSGKVIGDFADVSHAHAAGDVTSGTFDDGRIAASNVTQHVGAIDHDSLLNYVAGQHRAINDAGAGVTDLWSASKITSELSSKADSSHTHAASAIVSGQVSLAQGGTAADLSGGSVNLQFVRFNATSVALEASGFTDASFAAASHNHSASHITSDVLVIARGGTNNASYTDAQFLTFDSALNQFQSSGYDSSDFAAASHAHAAGDITSGTLALARGGTNADLSAMAAYGLARMNAGQTAFEDSGATILVNSTPTTGESIAIGYDTGALSAMSTLLGYQSGESSTGLVQTFFGAHSGQDNTGTGVVGIGTNAARENTGYFTTCIGVNAGYPSTGTLGDPAYLTAIGGNAGRYNVGTFATGVGGYSLHGNRGEFPSGLGWRSGRQNFGDDIAAVGLRSLENNDGDQNTALGAWSFRAFANSAAQTFDYTDITVGPPSQITVTGHGFGAPGAYVHLRYEEGTGPIPYAGGNLMGTDDGSQDDIYPFRIVDVDTVQFTRVELSGTGSGTGHKLYGRAAVFSNSTAIGYQAEPDASNQCKIGDSNLTSIKSTGLLNLTNVGANQMAGSLNVDTINEFTGDTGVTIDGLLVKDGLATGYYTSGAVDTLLGNYLNKDGTVALTANWDAGGYKITAETFESDVTTGTAPFTIASTTLVSNLNADLLDGNEAAAFAAASHAHSAGDITSGTLPVARGGSGNTTFSDSQFLVYMSGAAQFQSSGYAASDFAADDHDHDSVYLALSGGAVTGDTSFATNISVDTINEYTATAGVTIDGVKMYDDQVVLPATGGGAVSLGATSTTNYIAQFSDAVTEGDTVTILVRSTLTDEVDVDGAEMVGDILITGDLDVDGLLTATDNLTCDSVNHRTYLGLYCGGTPGAGSEGTHCTFVGEYAGYHANQNYGSAFGYAAGYLNTGANQSAFGYVAGRQNTGLYQSAFGSYAGQSNTGAYQSAFGSYAGYSNTGSSQSAFGYYAGCSNTGSSQSAFGHVAGHSNTGANQSAFGYYAGCSNTGAYQSAFGSYAGYSNTGSNQSAFGHYAGYSNTGLYQSAFGHAAGRYNDGASNTAIGYDAFNAFNLDAGSAVSFDYTDVDQPNNRVTCTGHGLGANDTYRNLRFDQGTDTLPGIDDTGIDIWKIVDANTLQCMTDTITAVGIGEGHTLTPQYVYSNSTAVGYNAEPDASNQIKLGDANVTELKTAALLNITRSGTNQLTGGLAISGTLTVDTINEKTGDAGVTIDGVLIKDGTVDGIDIATHTHAAGDIASGTVAIARGGTNAGSFTVSQLVRMNAGGTAFESSGKVVGDFAEASHSHAADDITSGQIGLAYGGTAADLSGGSVDLELVRFNSDSTALESSGYTVASFATAGHTHDDRYYTETELATGGVLDTRYYTESEVDSLLGGYSVTSHTHDASAIVSGTLTHERGGLEADVSEYAGFVLITGGATSAVAATGTDNVVRASSPTIVTPTIASFTNAAHTHQDAAGGAQLDHGLALTGLTDDDHTQYHTDARGDARYVMQDGTQALSANWDAGSYKITAQQLAADVAIGTAPLVITSTTVVANLNADLLDGNEAAAFATASHAHAAGDITSGTLALARGGTNADLSGVAASRLIRMNAGQTALEDAGVTVSDLTTDAELTTHAGLDTGVHGVGASTVASASDIATAVADYLPLIGGTITGSLNVGVDLDVTGDIEGDDVTVNGALDWSTEPALAYVLEGEGMGTVTKEFWFELNSGNMYCCLKYGDSTYKAQMTEI